MPKLRIAATSIVLLAAGLAAFFALTYNKPGQQSSRGLKLLAVTSGDYLHLYLVNQDTYGYMVDETFRSHGEIPSIEFEVSSFFGSDKMPRDAEVARPRRVLVDDARTKQPLDPLQIVGHAYLAKELLRPYQLGRGCYRVQAEYKDKSEGVSLQSNRVTLCVSDKSSSQGNGH